MSLCCSFISFIACLVSVSFSDVRIDAVKEGVLDKSATSKLLLAVDANDYKAVVKALNLHANVNARDHKVGGRSALMLASGWSRVSIVKLLISHGANVNARDDHGRTALMYAIDKGNFDSADLLIASHSHLDIRDAEGQTALHWAYDEHVTHNKSLHHEDWVQLRKLLREHGARR